MRTLAALALAVFAASAIPAAAAENVTKAPPGGAYQPVSKLVPLPDFLPGMGTLYVDPKTLPAGPFLAYDRNGKLVSTIYMIPLKDFDSHKKLDDLKASGQPVDHVDMYFNAGHPGVQEPHYHIVLWHVPPAEAAAVK